MKRKRFTCCLLLVCALSVFLSFPAQANAPDFPDAFSIYLEELPENAAFVDMLVELPTTDPHYSPLEEQNIPDTFTENAEILTYCDTDGYRSYSFHYQDALSTIAPKDGCVLFFENGRAVYDARTYDHSLDISARGSIKLALVDKFGTIVHVSKVLPVKNGNFFLQDTHSYYYNVSTGEWTIDTFQGSFSLLFEWFLRIPCMVGLNILLELLIAVFFGICGHSGCIALTNLTTQLLMRFLYFILKIFVPVYWILTFILEFLVYLSEYLTYRKFMHDIPNRKRLAYTVTANTVTLVIGILLNTFFFP